MAEDRRALNHANWDERTPLQLRSAFYDMTALRAAATAT